MKFDKKKNKKKTQLRLKDKPMGMTLFLGCFLNPLINYTISTVKLT